MKRHLLLLSMGLVLAGSALALQLNHEGGPAAGSSTSTVVSASTVAPAQTPSAPSVAPQETSQSTTRSVTKKTTAAIRTAPISPSVAPQQNFGDDGAQRGYGDGHEGGEHRGGSDD